MSRLDAPQMEDDRQHLGDPDVVARPHVQLKNNGLTDEGTPNAVTESEWSGTGVIAP